MKMKQTIWSKLLTVEAILFFVFAPPVCVYEIRKQIKREKEQKEKIQMIIRENETLKAKLDAIEQKTQE